METTHEHGELEQELRSLRPRAVAPETRQRIAEAAEQATAGEASPRVIRPAFGRMRLLQRVAAVLFVSVGGLCLWLVMRGQPDGEGTPVAATRPEVDAFEMVSLDTTVLAKRRQETLLEVADKEPMEGVEYDLVDRVEWQRAKGSERFIMERPRREVIFTAAPCY